MILKPEAIPSLLAVAYCLGHGAAHPKKKSRRKSPFRNPVLLIPFVNCLIRIPLPRFLKFEWMADPSAPKHTSADEAIGPLSFSWLHPGERHGAYIHPSFATVEASLPNFQRDIKLPHPARQSSTIVRQGEYSNTCNCR